MASGIPPIDFLAVKVIFPSSLCHAVPGCYVGCILSMLIVCESKYGVNNWINNSITNGTTMITTRKTFRSFFAYLPK